MANQSPPKERDSRETFELPPPPPVDPRYLQPSHSAIEEQRQKDIAWLLLGFRFVNALFVSTFFQPDEYYQALEPAWQIAFGPESGAWITWEWKHQLRSSLHPMLFAAVLFLTDKLLTAVSIFPQLKAVILIVVPRVVQGLFATAGDWATWKLAERIYGRNSGTAWTALAMTLLSPWQWFASTRTFSNSLEAALTIVALNYWPWQLSGGPGPLPAIGAAEEKPKKGVQQEIFATAKDINRLRLSLVLAGFACILRPTNLFIWLSLVTISITRLGLSGSNNVKFNDWVIVLREVIICGGAVLAISALSDRFYYNEWTFPPYQWLHFNITQSLAIFYGVNDWHYYLSQGLPLLLTTYLPFAIIPLVVSPVSSADLPASVANFRFQTTFIVLTTIATLSTISHKEVRFIYPLLPLLHVLAAPHALAFFTRRSLKAVITQTPSSSSESTSSTTSPSASESTSPETHKETQLSTQPPSSTPTTPRTRNILLTALLLTNFLIATYTTHIHARAPLTVLSHIRQQYETLHLSSRGLLVPDTSPGSDDTYQIAHLTSPSPTTPIDPSEPFVAFLMPCHSVPWRSHLSYPSLNAWALTCEPPLHIPSTNTTARKEYRDEADRFYDNPLEFLEREVGGRERPWPRFVVGFEGIEDTLRTYYGGVMPGWEVKRKWSGWNGFWNDDWRRRGRVVVWGFVEGREGDEQEGGK